MKNLCSFEINQISGGKCICVLIDGLQNTALIGEVNDEYGCRKKAVELSFYFDRCETPDEENKKLLPDKNSSATFKRYRIRHPKLMEESC